jgi:hypothetical protein
MNMENEYVKSKEKVFTDGQRSLYSLLVDHPHFQKGVKQIRKQLKIPTQGFSEGEKAFLWEHGTKEAKRKLWGLMDTLIGDFSIPKTYTTEARLFAYDYILSPSIVNNLLPLSDSYTKLQKEKIIESVSRHKIGAAVIQTGIDIELNKYQFKANATYLEIDEHSTERDLLNAYRKVSKNKQKKSAFKLPKPQEKTRFVWLLKREGLTNQEIASLFNKKFNTNITLTQVPTYAKRYEMALSKIRLIENKDSVLLSPSV